MVNDYGSVKMEKRAFKDAARHMREEFGAEYIPVTKTLAFESDDFELENLLRKSK